MEKLILIYVSALNLLKCIILVEVNGKKYICLYVCVCVYMYIHMHTSFPHMCVYIHTHTYIYILHIIFIHGYIHTSEIMTFPKY